MKQAFSFVNSINYCLNLVTFPHSLKFGHKKYKEDQKNYMPYITFLIPKNFLENSLNL